MDEDISNIINFKENIQKLIISNSSNTLPEKVDVTTINFIVEIE